MNHILRWSAWQTLQEGPSLDNRRRTTHVLVLNFTICIFNTQWLCIYIIISTIYIYIYIYMHDHAWEFIYKYKHIYSCIIMYILYIHAREHGHVKFSVMIPWKSIQRPVQLPVMFCRGSLKCWSPCRVSPWKFWKLNSSGHKLGS